MKSFIFCQSRTELYPGVDVVEVVIVDTLPKALGHRAVLLRHSGWIGYLKLLLKSLSRARVFYFSQRAGHITACGTIALGFCNHYPVSSDSAVIGSIWTDQRCRGQGLASKGIRAAINHMISEGISTFYIDTQETNLAMLKAIEKTGFGKPVDNFEI